MSPHLRIERDGPLLRIGIDRPDKRNAFTLDMLQGLSAAYTALDRDPELRVGLVHAFGPSFTAGLDLPSVAPHFAKHGMQGLIAEGGVDPFGLHGAPCRKPVVVALQGHCYTVAIELVLAADLCVAAEDCDFAQIEVLRGILPFGGATLRLPPLMGWPKAMQVLLAGEHFDAAEALRLGLVNAVVPVERLMDTALALARRVAEAAPLAVQATLANARLARSQGPLAAAAALEPALRNLLLTQDVQEGVKAMVERRAPKFLGR